MAKLIRKSRPAPKRKALASKVVTEGTGDDRKLVGTKEQLAALAKENFVKGIKPK